MADPAGLRCAGAAKTVIVIAHRLATLQRADQILVLDGGRLVQQGVHADLIAQEGLYQRFWQERERAKQWKLATNAAVLDRTIL